MNKSPSTGSGPGAEISRAARRSSASPGAAALLLAAIGWSEVCGTAARTAPPGRLAIYYGIPGLVNGAAGDAARAAEVFGEYDIVVFGDGLQFPDVVESRTPPGAGAAEHERTAAIIRLLARTGRTPRVFGYVDLGHSQRLSDEEVARRIVLWKRMGAAGVFLDEAGFDFGVTRARQNRAVDAAHGAGLRVIMNAFNPDDVFARAHGLRHHLRPGDAYLLESFLVRNGEPEPAAAWSSRTTRAVAQARRAGIDVLATTTTVRETPVDAERVAYAWWGAVLHGIDAFGWGEPSFSAADSRLPWRSRPERLATEAGTDFIGAIEEANGVYARATDRGRIEVDTRRGVAGFKLRGVTLAAPHVVVQARAQ